jgi:hypothetical protein
MYCSKCGAEMSETALYCSICGEQTNSRTADLIISKPPKKSILRIIGGIICILTSIFSSCLLGGDYLILNTSAQVGGVDMGFTSEGNSNLILLRIGFLLLILIFSIVSISIQKPSKIISITLLLIALANIGIFMLPDYAAGFGSVIDLIFECVTLIGAICIVVDSLIKRKEKIVRLSQPIS